MRSWSNVSNAPIRTLGHSSRLGSQIWYMIHRCALRLPNSSLPPCLSKFGNWCLGFAHWGNSFLIYLCEEGLTSLPYETKISNCALFRMFILSTDLYLRTMGTWRHVKCKCRLLLTQRYEMQRCGPLMWGNIFTWESLNSAQASPFSC